MLCLGFDTEWRFEQYHKVFDDGLHQQGICWKISIPAAERVKVVPGTQRVQRELLLIVRL